jgi:MFS family permease
MGVIGTVICIAGRSNYSTLMAGRVIQGFGATAFESLSLAFVGDIFYLHERGWRTALIVLTLACMASLVSIISGVITENLGYRDLFTVLLPFQVAGLLGTIFLLPESQFNRAVREVRAPNPGHDSDEKNPEQDLELCVEDTKVNSPRDLSQEVPASQSIHNFPPKKTFLQTLVPFSGVYTDRNIFLILGEIFIHLLNPAVVWILLTSAVMVVSHVQQDADLKLYAFEHC